MHLEMFFCCCLKKTQNVITAYLELLNINFKGSYYFPLNAYLYVHGVLGGKD